MNEPNPPATATASGPATAWAAVGARVVLWAGAPACLFGLAWHHMGTQWRPGRFGELLLLALLSLALARALARVSRARLASALAIVWLLPLLVFAGPLPVLATVVFALAALAIGQRLVRADSPALQVACGLALSGGVLGWLLPLPVHWRAAYLGACVLAIAWRWRAIATAWRQATPAWRDAVDAAPRDAAFAILLLGLASTACWLPTLQWDDLVYHLRLPWQLLEQHRYPLAPGLHQWSMAPWLGDVLQAVPQLIAAGESRGAMDALWLAITAAGTWRLARALGATPRAAWLAVALYASLPTTAALAGGMQTELPAAAWLVWLLALVADTVLPSTTRRWCAGALLAGGLIGLKFGSAACVVVLLPWMLWRHRAALRTRIALAAVLLALAVGGSSYVYAAVVAHNPLLPLFNGWFHSPYAPAGNFADARWHAGFTPALPWQFTFDTHRYDEGFAGGAGFVLVALAGAWLLALLRRRTFALALSITALMALTALPMQYWRYLFPPLVAMLPLLAITALRTDPRRGAWLLVGVCVLDLAFQANGFWLLRVGAVKTTLLHGGRDAPLFERYVPERRLLSQLHRRGHGNVLALDADAPFVAELGLRGRSTSGYDPGMQRAAAIADADPSGAVWARLLRGAAINDVLLRPGRLSLARRAGLQRLHATPQSTAGDVTWWRIPDAR
jgi:hypothetical protein